MAKEISNPKLCLDVKYSGLENSIWVDIIALYAQYTPLDLAVGSPNYMPAPQVLETLGQLCTSASNPALHQYTRPMGHPRLVRALASLYGPLVQRSIDPMTEVMISEGAYGALSNAIMSHVGVGDEVIIIEPFFDCYAPLVTLAGGICKYLPLRLTNETNNGSSSSWKLNSNELKSLFTTKTKAIIVNTPNNPLGKVFSREELEEISALCKEFNVLVISDEVYEWIVYPGKEHVRIASLDGMWERTITIGSAGKAFGLTGWKIGWAYGEKTLIRNMQVAHQNSTLVCQTPCQEAVAIAIEKEVKRFGTTDSYFQEMVNALHQKRDALAESLKKCGLEPILPDGGYFLMTNWEKMKLMVDSESEFESSDYNFVKWLTKNWKIMGIPPSAFYSQNHKELGKDYVRFCFYKNWETLEKAAHIFTEIGKTRPEKNY